MKTYKDKVSGETLYVSQSYGFTEYYKDKSMTIRHRLDGPANEYANGRKEWVANGTLHRLNGPAIEDADGCKLWCVDGVTITFITSSGEYEGPESLQDDLNKIKSK